MEKYSTKVRQAISDEYVRCSKEKAETEKEFERLAVQLANDDGVLTHKQYLKLSADAEHLRRKIEYLGVELDIWDKAREICLNIADEIL